MLFVYIEPEARRKAAQFAAAACTLSMDGKQHRATPAPRGCALRFPLSAQPAAAATPARAIPSAPSPPSPESDSTRRNLPPSTDEPPVNLARPSKSPASASCVSRVISAGISLDATEITPRPPIAINGSVIASSPESTRNSSGTQFRIVAICPTFPEASLIPTMLRNLRQPRHGGRFDVHPRAPLHAVQNNRQIDRFGNGFKMLIQTFLRRLVVIRSNGKDAARRPASPVRAHARSLRRCCIRPRPPAPALCPSPAPRVISTTRRCSSSLSVGLSPVVPHGTRKSIPASICRFTSARSVGSSNEPSRRNGVTSAVPVPVNMCLLLHLFTDVPQIQLPKSNSDGVALPVPRLIPLPSPTIAIPLQFPETRTRLFSRRSSAPPVTLPAHILRGFAPCAAA